MSLTARPPTYTYVDSILFPRLRNTIRAASYIRVHTSCSPKGSAKWQSVALFASEVISIPSTHFRCGGTFAKETKAGKRSSPFSDFGEFFAGRFVRTAENIPGTLMRESASHRTCFPAKLLAVLTQLTRRLGRVSLGKKRAWTTRSLRWTISIEFEDRIGERIGPSRNLELIVITRSWMIRWRFPRTTRGEKFRGIVKLV